MHKNYGLILDRNKGIEQLENQFIFQFKRKVTDLFRSYYSNGSYPIQLLNRT